MHIPVRPVFRASSLFAFVLLSLSILLFFSCGKREGKPRVLVFSKTAGFHHSSIPNGIAAIQKLGNENGFDVDTTTNDAYFNDDSLQKYATVVFMSTTLNVLNSNQQVAFERYIQSGGGYAGLHSASDTEYDWGWYGRLVGGYFNGHPDQHYEAVLTVVDTTHPATKGLPTQWKRRDEWYNFKKLSTDIHVLITIDEKTYTGGTNGSNHPMAWYHEYDGGRAFYTALGHTEESYTEPLFLRHLLGGIQYAMGDNKKLDYSKAKSQSIPEENRFAKTVLTQGTFNEPTEMAILPNLDILVTQRKGEIMMYSNDKKTVKQVGFLNAYYKSSAKGVNAEEGVLGITADPDFKNNNYIYIFYSPIDTSVNRLSRFTFKNDTLDLSTEKVVLQFYSQREICCHTGGSLTFGADNTLFLSTGDNSTPFDEPKQQFVNHGFAPLNDLPGHQQYDSRRSAGNTNDLRGKILRIKIKPDGTYEIPEGNLFPPNEPKARPEIYVMGNRNPYRISVDKKTGFLYWGEVGPDSNVDSFETRGPRGYDEVNQARKAGFFGWPLFIGNNIPYRRYDYATGKSGDAFDPARPVNDSRNNTGLQQLPPAQPAFIWYPYALSHEFPDLGAGSRTAMAGPVYHVDDFPKETRYPDYFNNKLFIYEWMRDWIKAVTMLPNGDFDKLDPFMEHESFRAVIDMELGSDGRLYMLEYGKGWFSANPDAGISRVDYISGNRPPKLDSFTVDKESGNLPLTITAKVTAKDPENNAITYVWKIGSKTQETKEPSLTYTFKEPGEYQVSVDVRDEEKATSKSSEVTVYAGNEMPKVDIILKGNRSFYFTGKPLSYEVHVTDNGDTIDMNNLFIATDFVQGNEDQAAQGHQYVPETILGKNIMMSSDCKGCHKVNEKSIGPSFTQVAQKYKSDTKASSYLIQKIIKGGAGVWGEVMMPAHTTMKEADVKSITTWVMSLAATSNKNKSLPPTGTITPKLQLLQKQNTAFAITASYTDVGGAGVRPLTGAQRIVLRNNSIDVGQVKTFSGFTIKDSAGNKYFIFPAQESFLKVNQADLTGIKSVVVNGMSTGMMAAYTIEIREGSATGNILGKGKIAFGNNNQKVASAIPLQVTDGKLHDVYIVVRPEGAVNGKPLLKTIQFNP